ncbi:MAG: hypothetical protein A2176_03140 [Spirochaetes bacterium RBG_13_51_14]|nr:MAG: hypothetical protein A2176_03140 [Spirochaetes bacterium RBG_13_51_14]
MESIITALTANKIVLAVAVIVSILILLSAIRKLVKVAVVLLALLVLYTAYMVYTGQKIPKTKREVIEFGSKKIEALKKEGMKTLNNGK